MVCTRHVNMKVKNIIVKPVAAVKFCACSNIVVNKKFLYLFDKCRCHILVRFGAVQQKHIKHA